MEPQETGESQRKAFRRTRLRIGVALLVVVVVAAAFWKGPAVWRLLSERAAYAGKVPTFSGTSDALERTVIVPTLDTPRPTGKNVIWCSSFQLAWNELRDNVIRAPLEVVGAEEVAKRLNEAKQSATDLEADSYYATGGWIRDGIIAKIENDMATKFPSHALPDFNGYNDPAGILAYSYLIANVPFKNPFRQLDEGLTFTDYRDIETQVEGFGLWQAFLSQYKAVREQIEILHYRELESPDREWRFRECVVDLCKYSKPYQVVIAMIVPKDSLGETLEYVRIQVEHFKEQRSYEEEREFREIDILQVPEMFWRIDHRFTELIGKMVMNAQMPIMEALQTIEFRLDRSGAMLESEALGAISAVPRYFVFDQPFLVCMKKRDAEQPFFVMWVDNAELLVRK